MKKSLLGMMLMAIICSWGTQVVGEELNMNFSEDPKLVITEQKTDHSERLWLNSSIPILATEGKSFALELGLTIDKFQHYGTFIMALGSDKTQQKIQFTLVQQDDRVQGCSILVQEAPGMTKELPKFDKMDVGTYKLQIMYNAETRMLSVVIRNERGVKIYEANNLEFKGKLNFNQLNLGVYSDTQKLSEISFVTGKNSIFWRSYVGNEDWYAYVIEGSLNYINMKTK